MVENSNNLNKDTLIRALIIRAAEQVFQKWGLNKTTMEDIAIEAGKAKSTLYYYFESKEDIFETVVKEKFNDILDKAKIDIQKITSVKEKLKKYIGISLTEIKKFAIMYHIVREEVKSNKPLVEKIRQYFEDKETQFLTELIALGVKQKEFNFSEEELEIAAKTIIGIIYALNLYLFFDENDKIDLIKKVDITARLIADGL